jgi:hypothetical protein
MHPEKPRFSSVFLVLSVYLLTNTPISLAFSKIEKSCQQKDAKYLFGGLDGSGPKI